MMNSPNLTTVPLPPANGRSIGDDSRRPASRGMLREPGHRIKTGENSRPTNGEYSTPAHIPGKSTFQWPQGQADTRHDGIPSSFLRLRIHKIKAVDHACRAARKVASAVKDDPVTFRRDGKKRACYPR